MLFRSMNSQLLPLLRQHDAALRELCRQFDVERLELFGSGTSSSFNPESSDLDFIVQMRHPEQAGYARCFCGFADGLEALLGCPVDLLTEAMIRNPHFRAEVERSREVGIEA